MRALAIHPTEYTFVSCSSDNNKAARGIHCSLNPEEGRGLFWSKDDVKRTRANVGRVFRKCDGFHTSRVVG